MFVIEKQNKIKLTKGDTATMLVQVFDMDNKEYEIKDSDVITLTVKKTAGGETLLTKTADSEHYIIIQSQDTIELNAGLYIYDLQLKTEQGFVYTIIPTSFFQLTSEVSV